MMFIATVLRDGSTYDNRGKPPPGSQCDGCRHGIDTCGDEFLAAGLTGIGRSASPAAPWPCGYEASTRHSPAPGVRRNRLARPPSPPGGRLQRPRRYADPALTEGLGSRSQSDARLAFSSSHPPQPRTRRQSPNFKSAPAIWLPLLSSAPIVFLSGLISTFSTSASNVLRSSVPTRTSSASQTYAGMVRTACLKASGTEPKSRIATESGFF